MTSAYYENRKRLAQAIPRTGTLLEAAQTQAIRLKGRKTGYHEYRFDREEMVKQERLLNAEEVNSFVEISCRAGACPMCLNIDVWDGLLCPYGCKYCFADSFRATLYTAFFDNAKTMGLRHCDPDRYKRDLGELFNYRLTDPHTHVNPVRKAIAMNMPLRLGIRFEDFTKREKKDGVSLELLRYLASENYPVMINTKSDLIGHDDYVRALADNKGKAAVHITLISSDDKLLKELEPNAPSYQQRINAMKSLVDAGIRVVARVEPYAVFLNDDESAVYRYIEDVWDAGVRNITFDSYSYTGRDPGIIRNWANLGLDWDRMFLVSAESQPVSSYMLGSFMEMFREKGFSCSTFDMGNVPTNSQDICCEVTDLFTDSQFNYGCTVMAARFVRQTEGSVGWGAYEGWVMEHGGFLSPALKAEVKQLWNAVGNNAYSQCWAPGIVPVGIDQDGIVWEYDSDVVDFRQDIFNNSTNPI